MTRKPHEHTRMAKYIERRVLELKPTKSQAEIAAQAGYTNANMITMIKQGSSKVALDRVPALAHALEADPAYVMRLALEQTKHDERPEQLSSPPSRGLHQGVNSRPGRQRHELGNPAGRNRGIR